MTHPAHPRCSECGKALYKSAVKGKKVRKADPYKFCRNPDCSLRVEESVKRLGDMMTQPHVPPTGPKAPPKAKGGRKRPRRRSAPKGVLEPAPVASVRKQIGGFLERVAKGKEPAAVALTLAITCQEVGEHEAANQLIEKHKLDKMFGIKPKTGSVW